MMFFRANTVNNVSVDVNPVASVFCNTKKTENVSDEVNTVNFSDTVFIVSVLLFAAFLICLLSISGIIINLINIIIIALILKGIKSN